MMISFNFLLMKIQDLLNLILPYNSDFSLHYLPGIPYNPYNSNFSLHNLLGAIPFQNLNFLIVIL
jgi:hypothetical protein